MSFQPNPGDQLVINGKAYEIGRHPAAQGLAYAQAGRQGIVYQLIPAGGQLHEAKALKVFFPKFRAPSMVYQSENMEKYSECQGLQVCKRDVLTPERNGELIAKHPDLLYAVLMPWIYGTTWFDMVSGQTVLQREESLALAKALASIGSGMEQRGLAHCDLSAPNVLLPFFSEVELPDNASPIELVDVEQMYSPKMDRPDALLAGSPGYAAHRTVHSGLWSAYADRFAGAILLAEMLGWCDPVVVEKSWGESYFDQHEMQNPCERFFILRKSLERNWGSQIAELFTRAWDSQDLSSCPTFGEWLIMLSNVPEQMPEEPAPMIVEEPEAEDSQEEEVIPETAAAIIAAAKSSSPNDKVIPLDGDVVQRLFHQGRDLEQSGDLAGALEIYRSAHHFVENGSPMKVELQAAIDGLQAELAPKEPEPTPKTPFYRSKNFMIASAAALILVAGSAVAVNHIVAEQSYTKQQEEKRLAAEKAAAEKAAAEAEAAKIEEEKQQEEARKKQQEQQRQQEEEQAKLAAQQEEEARLKEEERKRLQEKYDKQAKYEAYLAEQEAKKERQKLQEKYDKQAKYEAYLAQLAEKEEKAKAEAERKAQQEAAAAAQRAKEQAAAKKKAEQERQAVRSQNVVKLVASYDQAYNAQKIGNKGKARYYGTEFTALYEKDADYFKTVSKVSARAGHIYKMLYDEDYELPNL